MKPTLSVVIPVYNEASHLEATLSALIRALERSDFDAEIVLVDDGSTDSTAAVATAADTGRFPLRVRSQSNMGRFEARRAGLEAAEGSLVLLLDGRLVLAPDALRFVAERTAQGERIWTGDVEVAADGNPYAVFWKLLAELAWSEYFANRRTTRFDATNFDNFPKGTGCFLAPREVLLDAIASFRSRYSELRYANDDTPLIRWIAEREPIGVSPEFAGVYAPRTRTAAFLRHSFRRGIVFLDGHGRRESRFFRASVAFFPASAIVVAAAVRRPAIAPAALGTVAAAGAALGLRHRRTGFEVATLALLAPVYALAHGAGMWRGLSLLIRDRLRG